MTLVKHPDSVRSSSSALMFRRRTRATYTADSHLEAPRAAAEQHRGEIAAADLSCW
eukprot:CAMPEP_0113689598 /NCGR_PEP_ID=MMETSP0038_2-20120614/17272_1 /TAXON_ID=2898 /ORGANISM="Cryptomonas paramecium" /LENGTH=55 /DNA_ID=CAMNT_0000610725 /DNA_START=413 /DNA_END=580 /DNA_ORIENTATION=- /assembly_acc=CAM_ASM_000170